MSRTFGCCDRDYWLYKTITGFPAGTFQQLALPFALLYLTPFEGNIYHHDPEMLERARAAMRFWGEAQHRDGSLDEWYRNEYSYCATAFTTFGMSECLLLIEDRLTPGDVNAIRRHLSKSAEWISNRFNPSVMNQNLAACAALWNLYVLTDEPRYRGAFDRKWDRTLTHLDDEGWFAEYAGSDVGYSTLALDLLANIERRGCKTDIFGVAEKLYRFVASFASDSGNLAGRLGSRGTQHAFPFGLEYFADRITESAAVTATLRRSYEKGDLPSPDSVDDRYLCYFYLPQFTLSCTLTQATARTEGTDRATSHVTWSSSGFRIWHGAASTVVCSARRQGAFSIYSPGLPPHTNMGYWIVTGIGTFASAGWTQGPIGVEVSDEDLCRIRGRFSGVNERLPLKRGSALFRFASERVFRYARLAEWFQWRIKRREIMRRIDAPFTMDRTFRWENGRLIVSDRLAGLRNHPPVICVRPVAEIDVHSPSARLATRRPLDRIRVDDVTCGIWAGQLGGTGMLELETTYAPDERGRLRFVEIAAKPAGSPS